MTVSTIAIDTNLLVYALSDDEPSKTLVVERLIESLDPERVVIPWQVACELNSNLVRMIAVGQARPDALELAALLRSDFRLVIPSPAVLDEALRIHKSHQVSYWDSMLIAACAEAHVGRLYTEDRQGAPVIAGVEIVNPFDLPPLQ